MTEITPHSIDFRQSIAFAYLSLEFRGYPSDWDGIVIELIDNDKPFNEFRDSQLIDFAPLQTLIYDKDNNIVMKDSSDDWNYWTYSAGDELYYHIDNQEELTATASQFNHTIDLQLNTNRTSLTIEKTPKTLYFAPFKRLGGKTILGNLYKKDDIEEGKTIIELDEPIVPVEDWYIHRYGHYPRAIEVLNRDQLAELENYFVSATYNHWVTYQDIPESSYLWYAVVQQYKINGEDPWINIDSLKGDPSFALQNGMSAAFKRMANPIEIENEIGNITTRYIVFRSVEPQTYDTIRIMVR